MNASLSGKGNGRLRSKFDGKMQGYATSSGAFFVPGCDTLQCIKTNLETQGRDFSTFVAHALLGSANLRAK